MLIGYCFTGSFCTLSKSLQVMKNLISNGHEIIPVFSYNVAMHDTRFYSADSFRQLVTDITGRAPVDTIPDAEPLGPKIKCDVMAVAPCSSTTLAKIAYGVTDTPVTLAVKAHVRNERPVVLAVCTNDGLGASARNIGELLTRRNFYFAPLYQDDYINKPRSLVTNFGKLEETIESALKGVQIQPILSKDG